MNWVFLCMLTFSVRFNKYFDLFNFVITQVLEESPWIWDFCSLNTDINKSGNTEKKKFYHIYYSIEWFTSDVVLSITAVRWADKITNACSNYPCLYNNLPMSTCYFCSHRQSLVLLLPLSILCLIATSKLYLPWLCSTWL